MNKKAVEFIRRVTAKLPPGLKLIYTLNAIRGGVALVNAIVAARFLGLQEYGKFVSALAAVGFVQTLFETRNSEAVAVFLSRKLIKIQRLIRIALALDVVASVTLVIGVIVAISLAGFIPIVNHLSHIQFEMIVLSIMGAAQILRGPFIGICIFGERVDLHSKVMLTEEFMRFSILVFVVFLKDPTASRLALGYAIVAWFSTIFSMFFIYRLQASVWWNEACLYHNGSIRDYVNFVAKAFFGTFLKAFHSRMDIVFMSSGFGFTASGILDLVKRAAFPLSFVMGPLAPITFKRFSEISMDKINLYTTTKRAIIISTSVAGGYFVAGSIPLMLAMISANPHLPMGLLEINILFAGSCVATTMWWARNFSNLTCQRYSIIGNFLGAAYMLVFAGSVAQKGSITLFTLVLLGMNLILVVYWCLVLQYETHRLEKVI